MSTVGILDKLKTSLDQFGLPVYYGRSFASAKEDWNYIIFNRHYINKTGKNSQDFNYYYQVHIIMENYITEGFEIGLIQAVEEETGLKLVDNSMEFNYATKNNSDTVIEMLTMVFTKPMKRCNL